MGYYWSKLKRRQLSNQLEALRAVQQKLLWHRRWVRALQWLERRAKSRLQIPVALLLLVSGFRFQVSGQPLPLPLINAVAPKAQSLEWIAPTNAQDFQVCIGPARGTVTNAFITTTNRIAVQPGAHYMIRARDFNVPVPPAVSAPVYWPRYPVVRLVNEVFETPGGPKIGEQVWLTYTSSIAGEPTQKFQRLRSETIRWE